MTDIQQARKWAKEVSEEYFTYITDDSRAAIKVIQSLPDHIIDAEKVREIYDRYRASEITLHEAFRAAVALTTPPLPTLAGLSDEERLKTKWGQADHATGRCVILTPHVHTREGDGRSYDSATLMWPTGRIATVPHSEVTPRPDLPRLEWPGDDDDHESEYCPVCGATLLDDGPECEHCRKHASLPRPEDVPAGEPWIVRYEREEWVGVRANADRVPWHIISMDGLYCRDVEDSEIALMPRLVPEVKP